MSQYVSEGEAILAHQTQFADSHIAVRLLGFDPSTRIARLAVDEKHGNVGFYHIWVFFGSGDSTRIDYDGGNPNRDNHPFATSNHKNDVLVRIEAKRVRD